METKLKKWQLRLISAGSILLVILIWELATDVMHAIPATSLPSAFAVAKAFVAKWTNPAPDGQVLAVHIFSSLKVALYGFFLGAVIGVPLGILTGWYRKMDMVIKPIFDFLRTIPPIGWIPLMIIWFGIGIQAKAGIVFLAAFIPCVINTYSGIKQTSSVHIWVAETFGASGLQTLFKVAIPTALPMIFTGLKLSLNTAWAALVAAELLGAVSGLGYMIQMARMTVRPDIIIVGMMTIGAVGLILSRLLDFVEEKLVKGGR